MSLLLEKLWNHWQIPFYSSSYNTVLQLLVDYFLYSVASSGSIYLCLLPLSTNDYFLWSQNKDIYVYESFLLEVISFKKYCLGCGSFVQKQWSSLVLPSQSPKHVTQNRYFMTEWHNVSGTPSNLYVSWNPENRESEYCGDFPGSAIVSLWDFPSQKSRNNNKDDDNYNKTNNIFWVFTVWQSWL